MSDGKISSQLEAMLRSRGVAGTAEIPILVITVGAPDAARLRGAGMKVDRVFESIPAAAGRALPDDIEAIARLAGVVRVELDGETRAM